MKKPIDIILVCLLAHTQRKSLYDDNGIRPEFADWVRRDQRILLTVPSFIVEQINRRHRRDVIEEEDRLWLATIERCLPKVDS